VFAILEVITGTSIETPLLSNTSHLQRVELLLSTVERHGNPMNNIRALLPAILFFTLSSSAFAQDPGSWPGDPDQATVQMQQSNWPSSDRYHDSYRRGYGYSGPDYTCPQPSVIVGRSNVPPDYTQVPASRQRANDPASREVTSDSEPSSSVAPPTSVDVLPAQTPDANPPAEKPYAILTCGTFVRLEFAAPVSSKKAQVGDALSLRVTDDIKVGNTVIVPRGTLADGNITFVRRTGTGGLPGTLTYRLNALHVNGTSVPLWLIEGRSGDPRLPGAEALIPVAGAFTFFRHGKDVDIKPGIPVTAFVAADTTLPLP
jgi:hypothetical protein